MKLLLLAVITAVLFSSCSAWSASDVKRPAFSAQTESDPEPGWNVITFKVAGELVKTSGWNISEFVRDGAAALGLNITTNMHQDKRTLLVNLNGVAPGVYRFPEEHNRSYGHFKPDYTGDLFYSYSFVSGAFDLTEVNTQKHYINATFEGTVRDKAGHTLKITDGKIIRGTLTELKPNQ